MPWQLAGNRMAIGLNPVPAGNLSPWVAKNTKKLFSARKSIFMILPKKSILNLLYIYIFILSISILWSKMSQVPANLRS